MEMEVMESTKSEAQKTEDSKGERASNIYLGTVFPVKLFRTNIVLALFVRLEKLGEQF
jgi:hypothetical protein